MPEPRLGRRERDDGRPGQRVRRRRAGRTGRHAAAVRSRRHGVRRPQRDRRGRRQRRARGQHELRRLGAGGRGAVRGLLRRAHPAGARARRDAVRQRRQCGARRRQAGLLHRLLGGGVLLPCENAGVECVGGLAGTVPADGSNCGSGGWAPADTVDLWAPYCALAGPNLGTPGNATHGSAARAQPPRWSPASPAWLLSAASGAPADSVEPVLLSTAKPARAWRPGAARGASSTPRPRSTRCSATSRRTLTSAPRRPRASRAARRSRQGDRERP